MKKHIALWVLQIAVAAMFVAAAVPKLAGAPMMIEMFDPLASGNGSALSALCWRLAAPFC